jgi:hypothetical protein
MTSSHSSTKESDFLELLEQRNDISTTIVLIEEKNVSTLIADAATLTADRRSSSHSSTKASDFLDLNGVARVSCPA